MWTFIPGGIPDTNVIPHLVYQLDNLYKWEFPHGINDRFYSSIQILKSINYLLQHIS
jgi:hypothetical protein